MPPVSASFQAIAGGNLASYFGHCLAHARFFGPKSQSCGVTDMRVSIFLLVVTVLLQAPFARAEATDVCLSTFEKAEQAATPVSPARRGVAGTGRLYFHSAPDRRCQLKDVFVIAGDRVEAFADYGEFTRVIYWNTATGAGTAGWVLSSRIAEPRTNVASGRGQQ
jgi:hypothetical protein